MRRLTRFVGLCLSLVLLQLVLVEGGYACGTANLGGVQTSASSAMPMPGSPAGMDLSNGCGSEKQQPCPLPGAPAGCQSMAPCALAALVSAPVSLAQVTMAPARAPVLATLMPLSLTRAPEPPPPRA